MEDICVSCRIRQTPLIIMLFADSCHAVPGDGVQCESGRQDVPASERPASCV